MGTYTPPQHQTWGSTPGHQTQGPTLLPPWTSDLGRLMPPRKSDLGAYLHQWHLVVITGDLFKLVNFWDLSSPGVTSGGGHWNCTYGFQAGRMHVTAMLSCLAILLLERHYYHTKTAESGFNSKWLKNGNINSIYKGTFRLKQMNNGGVNGSINQIVTSVFKFHADRFSHKSMTEPFMLMGQGQIYTSLYVDVQFIRVVVC